MNEIKYKGILYSQRNKIKIETVLYALMGMVSGALFVFGTFFPKYGLVEDAYEIIHPDEISIESLEKYEAETKEVALTKLRKYMEMVPEDTWREAFPEEESVGKVKITGKLYECLKEILNE